MSTILVDKKPTAARYLIPIGLIIYLALCLAGCVPSSLPPTPALTPTPAPTPSPSAKPIRELPADWSTRWLKGIPCFAPCWEGITPGLTSASEAVEILKRSPLIASAEAKDASRGYRVADVSWVWIDGKEGGEATYQASSPTIDMIRPDLDGAFRLRDFMQTYGEPSHVLATAIQPPDSLDVYYELSVVFVQKGIVLNAGGLIKPDPTNDGVFRSPVFLVPTIESFKAYSGWARMHPEWIVPWEAGKGFDFYCRGFASGALCKK